MNEDKLSKKDLAKLVEYFELLISIDEDTKNQDSSKRPL